MVTVSNSLSQQRGFTLIELMVTIAILAIVTNFAVPAYGRFITNQQLDAAARNIQSAILLTRSEAIKRNSSVYLTQNTGWHDGFVVSTNTARTYQQCIDSQNSDCIKVFNPPSSNYTMTANTVGQTQLEFIKTGRHSITGFEFTLCPDPVESDFSSRIVSIGTTGMPVITHGANCT